MKVYMCRNKNTGKFWGGRTLYYDSPIGIKSAWRTSYGQEGKKRFDEQKTYEIIEYEVIESKRYEELINYEFMYKGLE